MADEHEAINTEPLGIMDAIREITDTGKQKALAKFIKLMSRQNTAGWTEGQYFDAWRVFQVSERLERMEKGQTQRSDSLLRIVLDTMKHFISQVEIRILGKR